MLTSASMGLPGVPVELTSPRGPQERVLLGVSRTCPCCKGTAVLHAETGLQVPRMESPTGVADQGGGRSEERGGGE